MLYGLLHVISERWFFFSLKFSNIIYAFGVYLLSKLCMVILVVSITLCNSSRSSTTRSGSSLDTCKIVIVEKEVVVVVAVATIPVIR